MERDIWAAPLPLLAKTIYVYIEAHQADGAPMRLSEVYNNLDGPVDPGAFMEALDQLIRIGYLIARLSLVQPTA